MENLHKLLTNWQLHPFVDHFTIGLLIIAVLVDFAALIFAQRLWLRYMALTLMILGAAAAAASYGTGDIEGDRIWDLVNGPAKDVLRQHALLGYYLMITFGVLALWRILITALGFMERTRQIYLALALFAVAALIYQGRLGGQLVYTYGVGTGSMAPGGHANAAEAPAAVESALPAVPTAIPTVYVPTAAPTEAPMATPEPTAVPEKPADKSASPGASSGPSAEPSAKPSV
jgi:uncharacterized membrane protein